MNSSSSREPPLPYPPPVPFIPIHTASLDSHIGLLHPFYASKAGTSVPQPLGGAPVDTILAEDPINPLKVKMGPLGQIVPVVAGASKKKGGGGGGGGGGGPGGGSGGGNGGGGADTNVKPEGTKTPKKKKAKAPALIAIEPPLIMPNFASKAPAAPADVGAMMPDFSAFVTGGVPAGV